MRAITMIVNQSIILKEICDGFTVQDILQVDASVFLCCFCLLRQEENEKKIMSICIFVLL